jgi:hypothetical protein
MKSSRFALGLLVLALLSGCGPKLGPPTHQYLDTACGAMDQLDRDLAKETVPQAPALPNLAALPPQAQAEALQKFSEQLNQYDNAAQAAGDRVIALGDQALAKLNPLDPEGTDPSALDLVDRCKSLVNKRQQMAVTVQAMIAGQRSALRKGMVPRYAMRLVVAAVDAMFSPGDRVPAGVDLAAAELKPTPEEKSEATSQNLGLERAIAHWRSDVSETVATRVALEASLKTAYPDLDWSFLTSGTAP